MRKLDAPSIAASRSSAGVVEKNVRIQNVPNAIEVEACGRITPHVVPDRLTFCRS